LYTSASGGCKLTRNARRAGEIRFAALSRGCRPPLFSPSWHTLFSSCEKKGGELEPGNFRGLGVHRERGKPLCGNTTAEMCSFAAL